MIQYHANIYRSLLHCRDDLQVDASENLESAEDRIHADFCAKYEKPRTTVPALSSAPPNGSPQKVDFTSRSGY